VKLLRIISPPVQVNVCDAGDEVENGEGIFVTTAWYCAPGEAAVVAKK
jgi:hypothetical protein